MDIETYQIDGKKSGIASLSDSIFSLEPDVSIMSALVQWSESNQKPLRARTKNRSEVKGTTQKYGRQKGGGGARHGSKKANIFRSGGMAHNLRGERSATRSLIGRRLINRSRRKRSPSNKSRACSPPGILGSPTAPKSIASKSSRSVVNVTSERVSPDVR